VRSFIREFICISFIILFLLDSNCSLTQTYICPSIAFDLQKVVSDRVNALEIVNSGYSHGSVAIGLKLKQKIFRNIYLNYIGDYTRKSIHAYNHGGFLEDVVFHYNYFRNSFTLTYSWKNKIIIGGGKSFNILNDFYHEVKNYPYSSNPVNIINESGIIFTLGYNYKKYNLELYYFIRDNIYKDDDFYYVQLFEIYSLGLRFSYNFQIFDGIKKEQHVECPDFKNK
jgi:hypothetical protein